MFDLSDEATGLPPLGVVEPVDCLFAGAWSIGTEGLVVVDGVEDPIAVHFVSFRGIIGDDDGSPVTTQVHIALPHQAVRPLLTQWLEMLDTDENPDELDGD